MQISLTQLFVLRTQFLQLCPLIWLEVKLRTWHMPRKLQDTEIIILEFQRQKNYRIRPTYRVRKYPKYSFYLIQILFLSFLSCNSQTFVLLIFCFVKELSFFFLNQLFFKVYLI